MCVTAICWRTVPGEEILCLQSSFLCFGLGSAWQVAPPGDLRQGWISSDTAMLSAPLQEGQHIHHTYGFEDG